MDDDRDFACAALREHIGELTLKAERARVRVATCSRALMEAEGELAVVTRRRELMTKLLYEQEAALRRAGPPTPREEKPEAPAAFGEVSGSGVFEEVAQAPASTVVEPAGAAHWVGELRYRQQLGVTYLGPFPSYNSAFAEAKKDASRITQDLFGEEGYFVAID